MSVKELLSRLFGGATVSAPERPRQTVISALAAVSHGLRKAEISHAVIGGLALVVRNVVRATSDVDFLVEGERADDVNALMEGLGFQGLRRTENVANYSLAHQRVDFVFATSASSTKKPTSMSSSRLSSRAQRELLADARDPRRRDEFRKPEVPSEPAAEAISRMVDLIEALDPQIRANQKRLRELRPLGKFIL